MEESLARRPIKALGRHLLVRDFEGDGRPWTLLVNPASIRMSWDYLTAGNCGLSVQHDDGIIPEAPAQPVQPPIGIVESVELVDNTFVVQSAFANNPRGNEMLSLVDQGVLAGASPRLEITAIQVLDEENRIGFVSEGDLLNLSLVPTPDDPNLVVTMAHPGGVRMSVTSAGVGAAIGTEVAAGDGSTDDGDEARMTSDDPKPDDEDVEEGRDNDGDNVEKTETRMSAPTTEGTMPPETPATTETTETTEAADAQKVAGLERELAIMQLGYEQGVRHDVVMSAVKDGKTREQFAIELLGEKYAGVNYAPMLGQSKEQRPVRMGRLIAHMMAPQDKAIRERAAVEIAVMTEHNGGELDLSHVAGNLVGVGANTVMFALPTREEWRAEMVKRGQVRMTQNSAGVGAAIGTDVAFDMASPYPMDPAVDPILRRCYIREGLSYNVQYPVTVAGIVMSWQAEGADPSTDESDVQTKTLQPKELATEVKITRQSQVRTDGWAYENEMATLAVDRREEVVKSILGVNSGANAPTGIKDLVAGTGWDNIRAGKTWNSTNPLEYSHFTDAAAKVTKSKAPWDDRLYIMDVDTMAYAASTPRFQYGDRGIVDPVVGADGAVETYAYNAPAVESTLTDDDTIYYGHMASVNVGFFGNPLIWLDNISDTTNMIIRHFELYAVSIARGAYFAKVVKS